MADQLKADVVIVGAGVAGLLPAWKLAGAGVKVLVLEAGPRVNRIEAVASELIKRGLRGQALIEEIRAHTSRQVRFANLVEQLPDPENRVLLADKVDALGIPHPHLQYGVDEFVRQGMAEARRVSEDIFKAMGATFIKHGEDYQGAGHLMGTHRMGTDPKSSVVDPELRSHDHPICFCWGPAPFQPWERPIQR